MSWDKGFNFRSTSGFVTDGTNETYVIGDDYPVTRNGVTFGWTAKGLFDKRDRDSGVDRRLAGLNFNTNDGTQSTFQIDLPAIGDYTIRLALGDQSNPQGYQYWKLLDNTTVLATIDDTNGTAGAAFDDATGVQRITADWPTLNVAITQTFATTTLKVVIGSPGAQADSTTIAHLFVSQVVALNQMPYFSHGHSPYRVIRKVTSY